MLWRDKVIQHFSRSDLFSGRKLFSICVQESLYSCISNPLISEEEFILNWFYFWAEGSPTALSLVFFLFWKIYVADVSFENVYKPHTFLGHLMFYIEDAIKIQLWSFDTTSFQWEDSADFSGNGHWLLGGQNELPFIRYEHVKVSISLYPSSDWYSGEHCICPLNC